MHCQRVRSSPLEKLQRISIVAHQKGAGRFVAIKEGQPGQIAPAFCFNPDLYDVVFEQHPIVLAEKPGG